MIWARGTPRYSIQWKQEVLLQMMLADHEDIAELTNGQKRKEELSWAKRVALHYTLRWRQHPVEYSRRTDGWWEARFLGVQTLDTQLL